MLFDVVFVLGFADGDGVLRKIGDGFEDGGHAQVGCGCCGFEGLDLGFEGAGLLGLRGGVGSGLAQAGYFFGELVALGFEIFDLGDGLAALAVDGGEVSEDGCGVHATGAEFFLYEGEVRPDEGCIDHLVLF